MPAAADAMCGTQQNREANFGFQDKNKMALPFDFTTRERLMA
jgi:hypothetical protein